MYLKPANLFQNWSAHCYYDPCLYENHRFKLRHFEQYSNFIDFLVKFDQQQQQGERCALFEASYKVSHVLKQDKI